jgi:chromosomal replication initiation ATPase DnaA
MSNISEGGARVARFASLLAELAKWASPDLINLSEALVELVEHRDTAVARQPSLKRIKEAVAIIGCVPVDDLSSERRDRDVKRPRKVAMALCKHLTLAGYSRIGKAFARTAPATLRACKQLEPLTAFAAKKLPADAALEDWASVMLRHYESILGPDV